MIRREITGTDGIKWKKSYYQEIRFAGNVSKL